MPLLVPILPPSRSDSATQTLPEADAIPRAYICPITLDVMFNPYVGGKEGTSFEHHAIDRALQQAPLSPITRRPLSRQSLIPNKALREAIDSHPLAGPRAAALRREFAACGAGYAPVKPLMRPPRPAHNHYHALLQGTALGIAMTGILALPLRDTAFLTPHARGLQIGVTLLCIYIGIAIVIEAQRR